MTTVYSQNPGRCIEPDGYELDNDHFTEECPHCAGRFHTRYWQECEGGSINNYWSKWCDDCDFSDTNNYF